MLPVSMRAFSESERREFLSAVHVGVLSVEAGEGRPPGSFPIWYDYTADGLIRINTDAASRKARLIRAAGAVTLTVQREQLPYQYVVVEGTVVDTVESAPRDVREAIAGRYLGADGGRAFVDSMGDTESVLFVVRPDRWVSADFSGDV